MAPPISVKGITRLHFHVGNKPLYADSLVSDMIYGLILGLDWLQKNDVTLKFATGTLILGSDSVQLKHKIEQACVRRIYVKETI